jgi:hypothetical protein
MRILTKLVFDQTLTDTDKAVFIGLHYACEAKQKHTVSLSKVGKFLKVSQPNIIRSIKKFRDNTDYIVGYQQFGKATEYEFVLPNKKGIAFESINDEHLEKLLQYPNYLILFLKLKHINWQLEQDAKKDNLQFTNEVKALRWYGLDIDDFETTMDFLKGLGIVSNYQIKLSAQLDDGEFIFNNIKEPVIKTKTQHIDNNEQVAKQPKPTQQQTKRVV